LVFPSDAREVATRYRYAGLIALLAVAVFYRQDSLIVAGAVAAAPLLFWRRLRYRAFLSGAALALAFLSGPLSDRLAEYPTVERRNYAVTAVINGIGAVIASGDYSARDKNRVREVIDRIIDYDALRDGWAPHQSVIWHEKANMNPTAEDVRNLQYLYFELALYNPRAFLTARATTLLGTLGHGAGNPIGDTVRLGAMQKNLMDFGFWRVRTGAVYEGVVAQFLFARRLATTLPQLVIAIGLMALFRYVPATAFVSAVLVVKVGLFFMFEPAAVFSYLYDLHLFGIFLIPLALVEWKRSRLSRCVDSANDVVTENAGEGADTVRRPYCRVRPTGIRTRA
jgi:hypothetical protein